MSFFFLQMEIALRYSTILPLEKEIYFHNKDDVKATSFTEKTASVDDSIVCCVMYMPSIEWISNWIAVSASYIIYECIILKLKNIKIEDINRMQIMLPWNIAKIGKECFYHEIKMVEVQVFKLSGWKFSRTTVDVQMKNNIYFTVTIILTFIFK